MLAHLGEQAVLNAEIITLRAIALKRLLDGGRVIAFDAEIITLRAIALKPSNGRRLSCALRCRDHNATSYSTETNRRNKSSRSCNAEIITLRAIALKLSSNRSPYGSKTAEIITLRAIALKRCTCGYPTHCSDGRDHNATSYSTETHRSTR